jgi:hypothetical protein
MPDGVSFDVFGPGEISLASFVEIFQRALWNYSTIWIENEDGVGRHLNPRQILYFEEIE